jgi:hypothetical protein
MTLAALAATPVRTLVERPTSRGRRRPTVETTPDEGTRHMRSIPIATLALGAVLLLACDDDADDGSGATQTDDGAAATEPGDAPVEGGPYDPLAESRPDLLVLEPDEAAPGDELQASFPEGTERGIGYVLEEQVEDGWELRAYLTAAPGADQGPSEPSSSPVTDGEITWDAVAIVGEGPDRLVLPEDVADGDHRVCTAVSAENICAPLTISAP